MTTRKILHAADIHLDSPLQKLGAYDSAPIDRIRGASRRALENMVKLAIDQSVDLVVIAGDLYDGDWPDQNTGLFFVSQATRLLEEGIPLVVIRGNHDAASVITSSLPLRNNPDGSPIMMRSDNVDLRTFDSIGIAVHGRSFRDRKETENLAAGYPAPIGGMFNIGLLHTSLTGAEGHDTYAPCTPAQLADKHYDYWALGHVHAYGQHGAEGSAPVVFSGNIQGRHVREIGPKGCVIVEVDSRNRCTHSFHELDVVRWQICQIDASSMDHSDEVVDAFARWLPGAVQHSGGRLIVVRVQLHGETPLDLQLRRGQTRLTAALQATAVTHGLDQVWLEDVKLQTRLPQSTPRTVDLEGPMESLGVVIDQLRDDPKAGNVIEHELRSLLKKLPAETGGEDLALPLDQPDWIRETIESAASEVLSRLEDDSVNPLSQTSESLS